MNKPSPQTVRILAITFTLTLLAVFALPLAVRSLVATQQFFALAFGDTLTVRCATQLSEERTERGVLLNCKEKQTTTPVAATPSAVAPTTVPQPTATPLPTEPVQSVVFYVSSVGNDAWSGTKPDPNGDRSDGPFATLERARDAVRQRKQSGGMPQGGIAVELRGGVYELSQTFELTGQDSGTPGDRIVYRPYRNEQVRLLGGKRLDPARFTTVTDAATLNRFDPAARSAIRQIDLRALGIGNLGRLQDRNSGWYSIGALELFFNTQPMNLARWPNEGEWAFVDGPQGATQKGSFTYQGDRPGRWATSNDIWVHGYFTYDYSDRHERVTRLDPASRSITTAAAPFDYATYTSGQRFRFLNVLEELDQPGEWYLDRGSGLLYFWPPADLIGSDLVVSMLETPVVKLQDTSYVTLQGLTVEGTRAVGVEIQGGAGNLVTNATIRNTGTDAIRIKDGSNNGIATSEIYGVGDGGVALAGGDVRQLTPAGNYAVNNHIHHYSRFVRTYRPAIKVEGVGQRVANNLINDAPAQAIIYSGNDHVIELNEIQRVATETADVGAIYTGGSWVGRGNVLRYNYIHHIDLAKDLRDPSGAQCIYLDDYSSGTTVFGNVFYRCGKRAVFVNSGPLNTVTNNVFVGGDPHGVYLQYRDWEELPPKILQGLADVNYQEPPYSTRYPELAAIRDVSSPEELKLPRGNVVVRNLFYNVPKPVSLAPEVPLSSVTIDENFETSDDPGFIDITKENFGLRPDSPVYQRITFEPIPFERIGLQKTSPQGPSRVMLPLISGKSR